MQFKEKSVALKTKKKNKNNYPSVGTLRNLPPHIWAGFKMQCG